MKTETFNIDGIDYVIDEKKVLCHWIECPLSDKPFVCTDCAAYNKHELLTSTQAASVLRKLSIISKDKQLKERQK